MRSVAVALLLVLPLTACGGGSDGPTAGPTAAQTTPTKTTPTRTTAAPTTAAPTAQPATVPPTGTAVPEALSRFRCEQDSKGSWAATGYVANSSKAAVTFQVTVYIGNPTGGEERAKTTQLASIAGGGSAPFRINKVPAPADGGPCHVQVLATK